MESGLSVIQEIKTLLGRNLFVPKEVKAQILSSGEVLQAKTLEVLRLMDEKQTDLFKKILLKNPNFFGELKNLTIHQVLKRLVEQEEKLHLQEIQDAEIELEQMLTKF